MPYRKLFLLDSHLMIQASAAVVVVGLTEEMYATQMTALFQILENNVMVIAVK